MNIQDWNDVRKHPLSWAEQIFFSTLYMLLPSFRDKPFAKILHLMHHSLEGDTVLWLMCNFSAVYLLKTIKKAN